MCHLHIEDEVLWNILHSIESEDKATHGKIPYTYHVPIPLGDVLALFQLRESIKEPTGTSQLKNRTVSPLKSLYKNTLEGDHP